MKKLFLLSSSSLLKKALESLNKPFAKIKLVHVITASKAVDDLSYLDRTRDILDSLNVQYEDLDIDGKNEDELEKILLDKDAVFVNGGNTFYLLKSIRESGFDKVVKKLLDKGLLYIGASAGSYVACPTIQPSKWKVSEKDIKDDFGLTDLTGMNLVPFLLKVHYSPEQEEFLQEKIKGTKYPVKILTDEQAISVEGEGYKIVE